MRLREPTPGRGGARDAQRGVDRAAGSVQIYPAAALELVVRVLQDALTENEQLRASLEKK